MPLISKILIGKLNKIFIFNIPGETLEDTLDITALLHGNDTELILLINPDKEGLVVVVENTTAFGPVALHTGNLQVGVTRHEEEMVIDELLADLLVHAGQGVVVASEVTVELGEGVLHESLNVDTLLLGDSGGETESLDGAADTDPNRGLKNLLVSMHLISYLAE